VHPSENPGYAYGCWRHDCLLMTIATMCCWF